MTRVPRPYAPEESSHTRRGRGTQTASFGPVRRAARLVTGRRCCAQPPSSWPARRSDPCPGAWPSPTPHRSVVLFCPFLQSFGSFALIVGPSDRMLQRTHRAGPRILRGRPGPGEAATIPGLMAALLRDAEDMHVQGCVTGMLYAWRWPLT